jgi:epoxyqueuosine reductase
LGFGLLGIAPAEPSDHADELRAWLDAGRHGEMAYLAEHVDVRLDPRKLLGGAESIICVADRYPDEPPNDHATERQRGRIARYAWGDDYHKTIKSRLFELADALRARFPGAEFRCTVDTAPALEREHAARAGLGWIGKHTLLLHPRHGSYLLLGLIVTTLKLQTSAEAGFPHETVPPTDHCGQCTRCIDACPTGCIDKAGYSIDASRCISYLTLEHRGVIDESLHEAMGDWVAGCDVCQEVCPFNGVRGSGSGVQEDPTNRLRFSALPVHPAYEPRAPAPTLDLLDVLGWSIVERREAFTKSALKRIKLDMLKRNALIALGNALTKKDDPAVRARIAQIADDEGEPELVRATARQVLTRLGHGR